MLILFSLHLAQSQSGYFVQCYARITESIEPRLSLILYMYVVIRNHVRYMRTHCFVYGNTSMANIVLRLPISLTLSETNKIPELDRAVCTFLVFHLHSAQFLTFCFQYCSVVWRPQEIYKALLCPYKNAELYNNVTALICTMAQNNMIIIL